MKSAARRLVFAAGLIGAAALAGCRSSDLNDVSYDAVSSNVTPELLSSIERPIDIDRNIIRVDDRNGRSMYDDLGRALYTNRPSRLSPYPVINTSGH